MSPRCDRTLQREPGQRLFAFGPVAQVQVAFRYRDAGMAEQFLEGIDVDPGLQHPGGEGVPQGMPDHPVARVRHAAVQAASAIRFMALPKAVPSRTPPSRPGNR